MQFSSEVWSFTNMLQKRMDTVWYLYVKNQWKINKDKYMKSGFWLLISKFYNKKQNRLYPGFHIQHHKCSPAFAPHMDCLLACNQTPLKHDWSVPITTDHSISSLQTEQQTTTIKLLELFWSTHSWICSYVYFIPQNNNKSIYTEPLTFWAFLYISATEVRGTSTGPQKDSNPARGMALEKSLSNRWQSLIFHHLQ